MHFRGVSAPIDGAGMDAALSALDVDAIDLWTVIGVETSGCGYLADQRVKILFERHIFSRETEGRFDRDHPDISDPNQGGYGAAGAAQYERLRRAMALDQGAALRSASWGLGQVMGFNAALVGYRSVQEMIAAMVESENAQVMAMARYIAETNLAGAMRTRDWERFARGYNGWNYKVNAYDTLLATEYSRLERRGLPDLVLRAAQTYLTFLGYEPRGIDGLMGKYTRSAMQHFQADQGMPVTQQLDEATFEQLKREAQRSRPPPDA
jgi:hypothetical protein